MRRTFAILALIGVASFFLWPSPARSQNSAQDGQSFKGNVYPQLVGGVVRSDSTSKAFTMSSTGGLSTYDEDRDRDKVTTWDLFSGTNLAVGAADSTNGCVDVHSYRYLKLLLKITPRGNFAGSRVAFQFRECLNDLDSDTTSVYAEYQYGMTNQGVALSAADSTVWGSLQTGATNTPWSGEYVVSATANRNSPGNAQAAVVFSYPNGMSIPLDTMFGRPARFRYLSVRARNIGGGAVDYTVKLIGFAQ